MARKNVIIAIAISVIAIIAISITLAVLLSSSNNDGDSSTVPVNDDSQQDGGGSSSDKTDNTSISLLAIGDWGATRFKPGSCCGDKPNPIGSQSYLKDYHSQVNIGKLLAASADELKPSAIIGHGDNIYWNGLSPSDATAHMDTTFTKIYNRPSLALVPWFNVAGNHDLGGSSYICGDSEKQTRPCKDSQELIYYLNLKFTLQRDYQKTDKRWNLKDHYYKESIVGKDLVIDVFNIDTNFAETHAATQICCQCYGYAKGDDSKCNAVRKGDKYCAGGDVGLYNSCMEVIKKWWDDSVSQLTRDLEASSATYKVINTHYSPHYHMTPIAMKIWYNICSKYGVHLWMNGHDHGFNHDVPNIEAGMKTHFFENGGGGGIKATSAPPNVPVFAQKYLSPKWHGPGNPYGFFELTFKRDYVKVQFVTFDSKWIFNKDANAVVEGGISRQHCWLIPSKVGENIGKPC